VGHIREFPLAIARYPYSKECQFQEPLHLPSSVVGMHGRDSGTVSIPAGDSQE